MYPRPAATPPFHISKYAAAYRVGQKKVNPKSSTHKFVKYWPILKNSFTVTISRKFAMQQSLTIPPHLKRVATLPCEMFMSGNSLLISEIHLIIIIIIIIIIKFFNVA